MNMHSNALLVACTVAALAGCASAPKQEVPVDKPQPVPPATVAAVQPVVAAAVQETESQRFGRLIKGIEGHSVYFGFDDFTIKPDYRQAIQAHADVLRKTARGTVVLEGNADERGSREYNLALGQKRAEAVARALKTLGVAADQIEAVSFGKEKPRSVCHEEKCWAENRRVDFAYKLR